LKRHRRPVAPVVLSIRSRCHFESASVRFVKVMESPITIMVRTTSLLEPPEPNAVSLVPEVPGALEVETDGASALERNELMIRRAGGGIVQPQQQIRVRASDERDGDDQAIERLPGWLLYRVFQQRGEVLIAVGIEVAADQSQSRPKLVLEHATNILCDRR
jgi:hypothetical protein